MTSSFLPTLTHWKGGRHFADDSFKLHYVTRSPSPPPPKLATQGTVHHIWYNGFRDNSDSFTGRMARITKMAGISRMTFSNSLFLWKFMHFDFKFHWNMPLAVPLTKSHHLFRECLGAEERHQVITLHSYGQTTMYICITQPHWVDLCRAEFIQGIIKDIFTFSIHYSDVIMSAMTSEITGVSNVSQLFVQAQIKENIKAPRRWPLGVESTGDRWFPSKRASKAENVSLWWRHHVITLIWHR